MNVNPSEFANVIKQSDVYLLDVRPIADYEKAHIEGAHHLDVADADFDQKAESTLPKDKKIAVYCNTGKRSAIATEKLEKLGYNVINLENGITSWIAENYPTVQ